jgi:hypothetical protein
MCVFSHICNVSVFLTFHGFVPFFSMTMPVLLFLFDVLSGSGLSDLWPPVYADHSCPFSLRLCCFQFDFLFVCFVSCLLCPVFGFPSRCNLLADQSCDPFFYLLSCPAPVFLSWLCIPSCLLLYKRHLFCWISTKKKIPSLRQYHFSCTVL